MEFRYPQAAYIVVRATNFEATFTLSFMYHNKAEKDYEVVPEVEMITSFAKFQKTSMFRWIVFGSVLLLFVVSFLGVGLYYYSKKYRKVLYRVELLEGSKGSD